MTITSPRTRLAAAALAAAITAAMPSPAAAASPGPPAAYAAYAVASTGTYTYRASESGLDIMQASRTMDATWDSRSSRPLLLTRAANRDTGVVPMASDTTFGGTYDEVVQADPPVTQSCVLTQDHPGGIGLAGVRTDASGTVTLDIQPLDHLSGTQVCSKPVSDPGVAILGRDLSVKLTFPADRIGDETIVIPAASDGTLPCPSYEYTVTCQASWSGSVTLTRVPIPADADVSDLITPLDATPTPAAGAGAAPAPTGTPTGTGHTAPAPAAGSDDDLSDFIVPLVGPQLTDAEIATLIEPLVRPSKGTRAPQLSDVPDMRFDPAQVKLWFRAACGGGCDGTVRLTGDDATAGASRTIASASRVAGGRSAKLQRFTVRRGDRVVGLRLGAPIRAALRRTATATIRLDLRDRRTHARTHQVLRLHRA